VINENAPIIFGGLALLVVLTLGSAWVSKFGGTIRVETSVGRETLDAQKEMQRERLETLRRMQTEVIENEMKRGEEWRHHCWQAGGRNCYAIRSPGAIGSPGIMGIIRGY
jgi:hypothetical protein